MVPVRGVYMPSNIQLEQYLAQFLQVSFFHETDCFINGLVLQGTKEVKKIATAVTASQYAIEKAIELQCDALLVHHGLFLRDKTEVLRGSFYKKIKLLLDSGMNLFSYHLPLDVHPVVGNTWALANSLGWSDLQPFAFFGTQGAGVIGSCSYENPEILYEELCRFWKRKGVWVGPEKPISRCAFVSGKGNSFFKEAIEKGADCFITGTQDSKEWHMAYEENAVFMTFGHHTTETLGVRLLGKYLEEAFRIESIFVDEHNLF
jgi:dinuclear metal center YbgI/SA1388 family protein